MNIDMSRLLNEMREKKKTNALKVSAVQIYYCYCCELYTMCVYSTALCIVPLFAHRCCCCCFFLHWFVARPCIDVLM